MDLIFSASLFLEARVRVYVGLGLEGQKRRHSPPWYTKRPLKSNSKNMPARCHTDTSETTSISHIIFIYIRMPTSGYGSPAKGLNLCPNTANS